MSSCTFLIFFALVPLFVLEENAASASSFFWILWPSLFIWNLLTTWWIWNASPGGAAGAIIANSLLMCFPFMLYRLLRKQWGRPFALAGFVALWLSWEYLHHTWELSWPWLTLGNVFSTHPNWVQWYEYTGTTGGSLWILMINLLLFEGFRIFTPSSNIALKKAPFVFALLLLAAPLTISYYINGSKNHGDNPANTNVVVVQPNVEPYTEKFTTDASILIEKMVRLSESKIDPATRLVVWPETAIPVEVWENEISANSYYRQVFSFVKKHPSIVLVSGIDSYRVNDDPAKKSFSIRTTKSGVRYEAFNTAFATDQSAQFQLYHKSKLVPGVESLPAWLGFMGSIFDDLGGTSGTLGRSDSAVVFSFKANPYRPAPIICYESIYSNYVTEYVRRGANIITVVTNDGWWGNTPGYKQHMNMARLRAIENRRWVARSANTGISCFISPAGEIFQPQPWNIASAIKMNIEPLEILTFYSKNGDWLSRIAWPASILILCLAIFTAVKKHGKKRKKGALN